MTAEQFMHSLFGDLSDLIGDEDALRQKSCDPDSREHFLALLEQRGYDGEKLEDLRHLIEAPNSDLFDILAYIRFTTPPRSRSERANSVRVNGIPSADTALGDFLRGVLYAYEEHGEAELTTPKLGNLLVARYGSLADAKATLGTMASIRQAFIDVQREIYRQ